VLFPQNASNALGLIEDAACEVQKGRQGANWRELDGLPLITLTRDSGIRLLVEVGFETAQIKLVPAYEVGQITTALAMVEAGLGIAVLPTYAWAGAKAMKISATAPTPGIARDIAMIPRTRRSIAPAVSAFARFIAKYTNISVPGGAATAGRLPSTRKPVRCGTEAKTNTRK